MNKIFRYRGLPICEGDYTRPWSKLGVISSSNKHAVRMIATKLNTEIEIVERFYEVQGVEYNGYHNHGNWIYFPEPL